MLHAILRRRPDGRPQAIAEPLIPLLDTTLLTNAPGEPSLWNQLDPRSTRPTRIDVVMAFIRRSGIRPLLDALRRHCEAGRPLRVLTTTYTGSTERAALDQLVDLGAEVRVSYDLSTTRLHAKAWVFHRRSGFSTAYVGSSNLTHSAQVTGLEWNVRASAARNPDVIAKFGAVFDSYWQGGDFVPYDPDAVRRRAPSAPAAPTAARRSSSSPIELRPEPFQERLLELIELSRQRGHHRNLLVAATGTGKTVMAALDYARLRERLARARLLFVAHREEILDQSLATFRYALRDASFGEKWVGGARPTRFEHVFASIQSLNAAGLDDLPPDHFDVVIVDEFHHAAAAVVRARCSTTSSPSSCSASPPRPNAATACRSCTGSTIASPPSCGCGTPSTSTTSSPFVYFGIHDGLDLRDIPWRRGRGYDVEALTNVYTSTDAWARLVVQQVARPRRRPGDDARASGSASASSTPGSWPEHFNRHGIAAVAVWGDSPDDERRGSARATWPPAGSSVVFSVDLFNEGVDVPTVDTVLMLRPTESPTLFLQQLGRGLRTADGKAFCTVLDFVGTHRKEFRFDRRYRALLGGTRRDVERAVEQRLPVPARPAATCSSTARRAEIVLRSLREAIPSRWPAKVDELRSLRRDRPDVDPGRVPRRVRPRPRRRLRRQPRAGPTCCEAAGVADRCPAGPHETALRRARRPAAPRRRRRAHRRLPSSCSPAAPRRTSARCPSASAGWSTCSSPASPTRCSTKDTTLAGRRRPAVGPPAGPRRARRAARACSTTGSTTSTRRSPTHPDVPLQVHARYTRIEILAAFGVGERRQGRRLAERRLRGQGRQRRPVRLHARQEQRRLLPHHPLPRLRHQPRRSSTGRASPSPEPTAPTGLRYRNHERDGRSILLFARLRADDRAFWFLGPATYRGHVGEKPMAITWELDHPLPGDLYAAFAAAVA